MLGPVSRILLRYVAAALVAHGWLTPDDASMLAMDPDLQMMVGAGIGAAVEAWFALAKKYGWAT